MAWGRGSIGFSFQFVAPYIYLLHGWPPTTPVQTISHVAGWPGASILQHHPTISNCLVCYVCCWLAPGQHPPPAPNHIHLFSLFMFVLVLVLPPGSCACLLLKWSLDQGPYQMDFTTKLKVKMVSPALLEQYGQLSSRDDFRNMLLYEYDFTAELAQKLMAGKYTCSQRGGGLVVLQVAWGPSQIVVPLKGKWPQYFKPVPTYSSRMHFIQQC